MPPNQFGSPVQYLTRNGSCAFFHNADEEYRVLLPFIKDGFDQGERAFHIVDPKLRHEHRQRLAAVNIDMDAAESSGQFELRNWEDAYLRDGHFDQDRMLAMIENVLDGGKQQGFVRTRLVAHMDWALKIGPGLTTWSSRDATKLCVASV